jgi:acyl carrier protein
MAPRYRLTHVETAARVTRLAARHLGVEATDIDVDAPLDEIDIDSLARLALILEIEQDFDIDLDCYEALHVTSLRHLAGLVDLARAGTPALLF